MLKIINNQITYPYSLTQLRKDNPQVTFPKEMPEERLAEWGVFPVKPGEIPEYDPETHTAEEGVPELIEGEWTQVWNVRELTADELKARVPASITKRQARQELIEAGLIGAIESAINAIPDATQKALMLSWWNDSQEYGRDHPELVQMATAIGLSEAQLDALFIRAGRR